MAWEELFYNGHRIKLTKLRGHAVRGDTGVGKCVTLTAISLDQINIVFKQN